jgi:hypothetical protein
VAFQSLLAYLGASYLRALEVSDIESRLDAIEARQVKEFFVLNVSNRSVLKRIEQAEAALKAHSNFSQDCIRYPRKKPSLRPSHYDGNHQRSEMPDLVFGRLIPWVRLAVFIDMVVRRVSRVENHWRKHIAARCDLELA